MVGNVFLLLNTLAMALYYLRHGLLVPEEVLCSSSSCLVQAERIPASLKQLYPVSFSAVHPCELPACRW